MATPGRLIELIEANAVVVKECKILVLDEADKMLSLGFKEEMDAVLYHLPKKKQNLLFIFVVGVFNFFTFESIFHLYNNNKENWSNLRNGKVAFE